MVANSSAGVASGVAVARVVYALSPGAPSSGGRGEAAGTPRVEEVKSEGVFFRGEVQQPDDVDHREDQPSGSIGVDGTGFAEDSICPPDGEYEGDCAKGGYLEAVHGY